MGCLVLVCYLLSGISLLGGIIGALFTFGGALIPGLIGFAFWGAIGLALDSVDRRSKRTERLLEKQTKLLKEQTQLTKTTPPAPTLHPLAPAPAPVAPALPPLPPQKTEPPKPKSTLGRNDKYSSDYIRQFSKPEADYKAIPKSVLEEQSKWDFLSVKSAPIPGEEKCDFSALKSDSIPTVKHQKVVPWAGIALGVAGLFILVVLAALALPAMIHKDVPTPSERHSLAQESPEPTPSATPVDSTSATSASTPESEVRRAELVTASNPAPTPTVTFEKVDHQLNLAWYALPKTTRHRLLDDQRAWLKNRELLSNQEKIIETENRTTYLENLR